MNPPRIIRCAIYTRKSSEERLDIAFNSLEAQYESCANYIASQKAEGWTLAPARYDDGGWSGGTLERPALQKLLTDIRAGQVDVVVVYKIDRLSRSLMDFSKLVEIFDAHQVTFVAVTQSFSTVTSMGRLTLNILLSFAQFERELAGERIRDKFAASRARGMWMGGTVPLGYDVKERALVVNLAEAETVRTIFKRFAAIGSATTLAQELRQTGITTKRGRPIDKGALYQILGNKTYLGFAVHKGTAFPGQHTAIIDQAVWDKAHAVLAVSPRTRANQARAEVPALLKGLIFAPGGSAMSPSHTKKQGRVYRYYVTNTLLKQGAGGCPVGRVPAGEVEAAVIGQMRKLLLAPEMVVRTWEAARLHLPDLSEEDVRQSFVAFDALWAALFPAEQARIVKLLIERVEVRIDGIAVTLRTEGLTALLLDMAPKPAEAA
jgi:DNA invertase Pin-like site-specific DNA recombinase